MAQTFRSPGAEINRLLVGPLVMLLGVAAGVSGVVLAIVLGTAWFLLFLLVGAGALAAGLMLLVCGRRSRLEITAEGFTWCGFFGPARSLRWEQVHRIAPPPPAARRVAALAELRDGRVAEVRTVWESPTSPAVLLGAASDHRRELAALVSAHRDWLAGRH